MEPSDLGIYRRSKSYSGTSPAIAPNFIVIGVRDDLHGGTIFALSKTDGSIVWQTTVDGLPAQITSSPVVVGNHIYVGVSSTEEGMSRQPGYVMHFRGSVQALDLSGNIVWRFDVMPVGYTGGAVFGSNLVVDTKRGTVYAATGNNYTIPTAAQTCLQSAMTPQQQRACLDPNDFEDSVIALDMNTGAPRWGASFVGFDTTNASCDRPPPRPGSTPCPNPEGPDYDFASAPNLYTVTINGKATDILGAGHKSGVYWALDPDTGAIIWQTQVGPAAAMAASSGDRRPTASVSMSRSTTVRTFCSTSARPET